METFPQSKLSKEEQVLYKKAKASNPIFTNLTEDEFIEFRKMVLEEHSAQGRNVTTHSGLVMEDVPMSADELHEIREHDTQ